MPERMQVRDGFTHGKCHLLLVQRALEQHGQCIVGAAVALCASLQQFAQALGMVGLQLCNAGAYTTEGATVRGQHQAVVGQSGLHLLEGLQEPGERIGLGFLVVNADVR